MALSKKNYSSSQAFRQTYQSLKDHLSSSQKKKLKWIALLIFLSAVLDVFGLASVLPLVKMATEPQVIHTNKYFSIVYDNLHFTSDKNFMVFFIVVILLFQFFKTGFGIFVNYIEGKFMADVANNISRNQFSKYFSLSYFNFNSVKSSRIINHVQQNPASFTAWVMLPILMLFSESIILIFIVTLIAVYNLKLFLFILMIIGPASYLLYKSVNTKNEQIGRGLDKMFPQALAAINNSIMGFVDIKLANKIDFYREKFLKYQKEYHNLSMSSIVINMIPFRGYELVAILGIVVIFVYAIFIEGGSQDVIMMVGAFAAAAYRLMPSLNRIMNAIMQVTKNQVAIENLNEYNELYVKQSVMNRNVPIPFEKEITFENISFTFPKSKDPVLKSISFTVKKGEKVGFVGSSGSGKTTLMNILLRFFDEDNGRILIDGQPLKEDNLEYWRSMIGYVKQDIFMIDSNIMENVAFGEDKVDKHQLDLAVKQASLEDFVKTLPKGYDTEVGERGSRLSGGQRQRIGIARSLYRNAQILVFDEATSALDTQTEREVSEAIDSLSDTNKTIFIIAHRITTLKNCDRIYELKNGEISGVYTYNELVEKVI
ncbi:MAG TPA: ABC transporter ATP-binding protein [Bacteroidia bacterium]|nr:MAG: xenobiotic-transporting ATPase [Bacteroidetes bacterium OLB10]MBE7510029.1 ABC transporter ATP-binding protein [Bacteroidia bacterium]MBX3105375.1 ABC transporter ATP-binding protein [Bacteroidota bacterium]MCE7955464.1 ABC transporter ATP-binding protein [Bacteroidetes bacterium CHB6]OQB62913.1 MAG: putative multidrug export ATP-binding/permease protein [Bacteroidetes bacterium ADurb.Bin141]